MASEIVEKKDCLRFGNACALYYEFMNMKPPYQLDLINEWLPGLLIREREERGKIAAEYAESEYTIYASRTNETGLLYASGSSNNVTQILGRLVGTAKSNSEKGRKDTELIRKHISRVLIRNWSLVEGLQDNMAEKLAMFNEDALNAFYGRLIDIVFDLAEDRAGMSDEDKDGEAFPFEDHIFDELVYYIGYQLHLESYEGLCNAYLWLLLGSFLRNEISTVLNMYNSGFEAIHREPSETGELVDKLNYMFYSEEYYSVYEGDDVNKRFPGVTWTCDNPECEDCLNDQVGFDDYLPYWQCRKCGYINPIDVQEIYENEEDHRNGIPVDSEDFIKALDGRQI